MNKGRKMTITAIMSYVFKMRNTHICITGGEPMLQDEIYALIYELVGKNYIVSVETNGTVLLDDFMYKRSFMFTMDIKTPSSGYCNKNVFKNMDILQAHDEVKFVVGDEMDYNYALSVLSKHPTKAQIIFSPIITADKGFEDYQWLCAHLVAMSNPNMRLGVQVHKMLNIY